MLKHILLAGCGGAAGSIARFVLQKYFSQFYPSLFPIGTLVVNVSGCFLIGVFYGMSSRYEFFTPDIRLLLMTGFCGGFTTFSAFTLEGMGLLQEQKFSLFFLYFALSVVLGVLSTLTGALISR